MLENGIAAGAAKEAFVANKYVAWLELAGAHFLYKSLHRGKGSQARTPPEYC
jgi:hypothetical protein